MRASTPQPSRVVCSFQKSIFEHTAVIFPPRGEKTAVLGLHGSRSEHAEHCRPFAVYSGHDGNCTTGLSSLLPMGYRIGLTPTPLALHPGELAYPRQQSSSVPKLTMFSLVREVVRETLLVSRPSSSNHALEYQTGGSVMASKKYIKGGVLALETDNHNLTDNLWCILMLCCSCLGSCQSDFTSSPP